MYIIYDVCECFLRKKTTSETGKKRVKENNLIEYYNFSVMRDTRSKLDLACLRPLHF